MVQVENENAKKKSFAVAIVLIWLQYSVSFAKFPISQKESNIVDQKCILKYKVSTSRIKITCKCDGSIMRPIYQVNGVNLSCFDKSVKRKATKICNKGKWPKSLKKKFPKTCEECFGNMAVIKSSKKKIRCHRKLEQTNSPSPSSLPTVPGTPSTVSSPSPSSSSSATVTASSSATSSFDPWINCLLQSGLGFGGTVFVECNCFNGNFRSNSDYFLSGNLCFTSCIRENAPWGSACFPQGNLTSAINQLSSNCCENNCNGTLSDEFVSSISCQQSSTSASSSSIVTGSLNPSSSY